MERWLRRVRYVARRPWRMKRLLAQALLLFGLSRLALMTVSFQRIERRMGDRTAESPRVITEAEREQVRQVAQAIRKVSKHTPWVSNCFPQALTAQALLRRRGISSTIYLGAAFKQDEAALTAHAWTRCGPH